MKYIEASKKIRLSRPVDPEVFKDALLAHLEHTIDLDTLSENHTDFSLSGTTGYPTGMTRHARLDLDVSIRFEGENIAKIIISGHARTARSLIFLYWILFAFVLLVGLLPGSIETAAEDSGALDALVFVIFGMFIVWDINKKLAEPQEYIQNALESMNTRFS